MSAMCVVGWSVGIPFKRGTIDLTFSLHFDLNFLLFLLARALVYRHIAVLTLRRRRERVYP